MKKRYSCFVVIFFCCCNSNTDKQKEADNSIKVDTTFLLIKNKTSIEVYISKFVDSINNATNENELPEFLKKPQFDYQNRGFWTTLHTPISLRKQIINRVNNCKALDLIVNSNNVKYKVKPVIEDGIKAPCSELSNYDLVKERIVSLDCNVTYK